MGKGSVEGNPCQVSGVPVEDLVFAYLAAAHDRGGLRFAQTLAAVVILLVESADRKVAADENAGQGAGPARPGSGPVFFGP